MPILEGKNVLVTGGTGTIGSALVRKITDENPAVIRIYSRDESKQHKMRSEFDDPDLYRYLIGDVRDLPRLSLAMRDIDYVFHTAAMKHVLACEYNPFEAVKTNVIGMQNIVQAALENEVTKVVFTSTDKAANPSNTMGVSKLLGEKLLTAANWYKGPNKKTIFYSVRFGNVLGSTGSLIPIITHQIKNRNSVTLTDPRMTRYILPIDRAVSLVLNSMEIAQGGEVFVLKMPAVSIKEFIEVLIEQFAPKFKKRPSDIKIETIGQADGEKLYEDLFSDEEATRTYESEEMYLIAPQISEIFKGLNFNQYKQFTKFDPSNPYSSKDEKLLDKGKIRAYLSEFNLI